MLKEVATIKQDNNINNNRKTIHSQEKCPVYKKNIFHFGGIGNEVRKHINIWFGSVFFLFIRITETVLFTMKYSS